MSFSFWSIISLIWLLIKSIFRVLSKLWCKSRRKSAQDVEDEVVGPIKITIGDKRINEDSTMQHSNNPSYLQKTATSGNEDNFVDWSTWQDDLVNKDAAPNYINANLFEDMEPKLTKPTMVKVLKNSSVLNQHESSQLHSRLNVDASNMHFQAELGSWVDDQPGWDDDLLEESEISEETKNILKEKRRVEKQKRTNEQRRKKEEQRIMRMDKKANYLGVKVN